MELCLIGVVTTLLLWTACGGCPCTQWEHRAMIREGKSPYEGPWLAYYGKKWFGLPISVRTSSTIPIALLIIPFLIGCIVEIHARL